MQQRPRLAQIFQDEPGQWGLRGDPHLWRELRATLGERPLPETEAQLAALLRQSYALLTGAPLAGQGPVFVERFSHGGMSSGHVSPQFWAETALPLLLARYRELRLAEATS